MSDVGLRMSKDCRELFQRNVGTVSMLQILGPKYLPTVLPENLEAESRWDRLKMVLD